MIELPTGDRSADTSPKAYPAHYAPPPPPASLEPMAMGALGADDSAQRPALRLSTTPPLSVGIALLVLGAIFGATFSLVQRTHQHRVATASAVVAPSQPSIFEAAPAPIATPAPVAPIDDPTIELDASAPIAARATVHKVAPKSTKRTKAGRSTKSPAKAKEEARAAAPKASVAKEAPKKPNAPAPSPASAKTDDAAGLLKAAKGATENTL